ncbi:hypothetical protein MVEN_01064100 [Mycena venus]|uniref:F-box domain-containing protein n=1 Tax=Mycena venus TaxID=2733690 RepID=A0A8H7CZL7_9AGAR|nr:hypothetical protein MVEN_01064100 [Mycena venus]
MTIHFLDLPSEILVLILHFLDLTSLIACIAINRRVKSVIDGSAWLQYRMAAQAACVEDNPGNTYMTSTERSFSLQKRQTAFAELLPSSVGTIQMDNFPVLNSYALSGGIFVMTESNKKALRWERLELDEYILDFALAVPEENLLLVLSSNAPLDVNPLPTNPVLKLRLYEMSTGSAHRGAQEPVIIVPIAVVGSLEIELDICGPKVFILTMIIENHDIAMQSSRILVYDWKKGRLQMDLADNYSTAVFLSTDVILLANETRGSLELWAIPNVPERISGPEISLQLPQVADHRLYCIFRVDSNPKGNHMSASHQPFHSSFVDSIVALKMTALHQDETEVQDMYLIFPRRALLQKMSSTENRGEKRLWADWGPSISRWVPTSISTREWPTITCGQRCVFLMPDRSILLLDFNPHTRKRTLFREGEQNDDHFISLLPSELDFMNKLALCGAQVLSGAEYVAKKPREATTWDGVMMDEEWIVGIKDTTESDGKFSLEIWHLG